jgi:tetratricopeptide (TPR) repeat protein
MFLMLLDSDEPLEDRIEYAACLEELLTGTYTTILIELNLYSAPLPSSIDVKQINSLLDGYPLALRLFSTIVGDQDSIKRVRASFEAIPLDKFGGMQDKSRVFESAIIQGAFVNLARALSHNEDINFVVLKLLSQMRAVQGIREIVTHWTSTMRRSRIPTPLFVAGPEEEEAEADAQYKGGAGRQAYENVLLQQAAIIERLKQRNIDGARRFVDDLLRSQSATSSSEQIGKSLSRLSQFAKNLGVPELQLEWAQQAVEANPTDPRTHGHLADALILACRYNEASSALDATEAAGDRRFSEHGRARILRATARYEEARARYLATAAEFPGDWHSLAGAVEILRDMGRDQEALDEYEKLISESPLEPHFWTGKASVLMDLGRFDEAIVTFGKASAHEVSSVPKNGRATAYKLAGNFRRALQLYDEVIAEYPNDSAGLCGRAEVFRAEGDLQAALDAYELAIERNPFIAVPVSGKVEVLKELGRYSEATALLRAATVRFPYEQSIAAGYANILKSQGRYAEALAAYDHVIQRFPFALNARLSRIDVLKRLGHLREASNACDHFINSYSNSSAAKALKASILILQDDLHAAEEYLPAGAPKSQVDWSRSLLRALLLERKGDISASRQVLQAGTTCPFARHRRLFKAALARQHLQVGRTSAALRVVETVAEDVSNVFYLHVLAASGRRTTAEGLFEKIKSSEVSAPYLELSTEIARRFNIIKETPRYSRSWIFNTEEKTILLEAA